MEIQQVTVLEDELGDVVNKARIGQGVTVPDLAAQTGLTTHDIEEMQAYRLKPDRETIAKLAAALSLDDGKLAELSDGWAPAAATLPGTVEHVSVPYGRYSSNCYVLSDTESRTAAIIDPGGAVGDIMAYLSKNSLTPRLVLVTHAHSDHIGGLKDLLARLGAVTLVNHQLERDSVINAIRVEWQPAKDNVAMHLGGTSIVPLFTPGHTPGSTCYYAAGVCFTGDSLFSGSIGRPASQQVYKQMLDELRSKVLGLPGETVLLPGHGPATTVAEEQAHNPFF